MENQKVSNDNYVETEISVSRNITDVVERKFSVGMILMLLLILLFAAIALFYAVYYANGGYQRDLRQWEVRLGMAADARSNNVQSWVHRQFEEVAGLADNLSLRLYLTELNDEENAREADAADATFLRNLVTLTADRAGYGVPPLSRNIRANVPSKLTKGIVILGERKQALVASEGLSNMDMLTARYAELQNFLQKGARSVEPTMLDSFVLEGQGRMLVFSAPVFGVQADPSPENVIGQIVAIRHFSDVLPLLQSPPVSDVSAVSFLVRPVGESVVYLTSPGTEGESGEIVLGNDVPASAGLAAMRQVQETHTVKDYRGVRVLATGRRISRTDWTLVHKVDFKEAMGESLQRRAQLILLSVLAIVLMLLVLLAVWWHGVSVRYKKLATQFQSQTRLLRLMADHQPDPMYIVDNHLRYCFANKASAQRYGMAIGGLTGKTVKNIVGPVVAEEFRQIMVDIQQTGGVMRRMRRELDAKGDERIIQSSYIPLKRIPRVVRSGTTEGMLVVDQDVTNLMVERERHERVMRQVVDALVTVIDRRDPNSAEQSLRVAHLAEELAHEMGLDQTLVETASMAGKLMNLGKITLPRKLLTKKGKLTKEEAGQVSGAIQSTAEFLEAIEFDGPVVETIRQAQERVDGKGPSKLKGEGVLVTAQIIAITNAYVAMSSSRAYRPAMKKEKIIEALMDGIDVHYSRAVAVAMVHLMESGHLA